MKRLASRLSIGKPGSLNWRTHLVFAIPAFLSAGFFDYDRFGGNPVLWLVLATIGYSVTVLAIELLSALVRKSAWKKPRPFLAITILAVAGLARGLTVFYLGRLLGMLPESDFSFRLFGAPIFVVSIYLLIDAMVSSYVEHRQQVSQLTRQRNQLEQSRTGFEKEIARLNEAQRAQVRELVAPSIWELQKLLSAENKNVQDAIFQLKGLNEGIVRPLSREMAGAGIVVESSAISAEGDSEGENPSPVIPKTISISKSLNPWFFSLAMVVLGFNAQSAVLGAAGAAGALLIALPISVVAIQVFRRVMSGRELKTASAIALTLIVGAVTGFIAGEASSSVVPPSTELFSVQTSLFVAINMLFTLGLGAAKIERDKSLLELENTIEDLRLLNSRLRQRVWLGRKALSMELHGPIQGTLQSVAAKLSKLSNPTDAELQESLAQVRQAFQNVDREDYLSGKNLPELLEELELLWDGALDLQINMTEAAEEALEGDLASARCVLEVCREATTNAVKHGAAEQVKITIDLGPGFISIVAENDGKKISGKNVGQGVQLYRDVAHSHTISNTEAGVKLSLELPVSL